MNTIFTQKLLRFSSEANTRLRNCGTSEIGAALSQAKMDFARLRSQYQQLPQHEQFQSESLLTNVEEWLKSETEKEQRRQQCEGSGQ